MRIKEAEISYKTQLDSVMDMYPESVVTFRFNLDTDVCGAWSGKLSQLYDLLQKDTLSSFTPSAAAYLPDEKERTEFIEFFSRESLRKAFLSDRKSRTMSYTFRSEEGKDYRFKTTIQLVQNPRRKDIEGTCFTLDVTEKEARDRIEHVLFKHEHDCIVLINIPQHTFHYCSYQYGNYEKFAGLTMDYEIGRDNTKSHMIAPEDREAYVKNSEFSTIVESLKKGTYCYTVRFFWGGKKQLKRFSYQYLDEKQTDILLTIDDITEVFQKEHRQMDELQKALKLAEKATEAKNTFLSTISHDMRTPLNGVIGFTALAIDAPTIEEKNGYLKDIKSSGEFLLQLINDTLDLSKIESNAIVLHPTICRSMEVLKEIICYVKENAEKKHIDLKLQLSFIPCKNVLLDKLRFQQVFVNLLSNAIKFTPEGGHVLFSVDRLSYADNVGTYRFTVKDDGVGMSKEFLPQAFEPFTREVSSRTENIQGTGLGLAIVKRTVILMGGTIRVESEENKGSTFITELPVRCTDEAIIEDKQDGIQAQLKGKHVLLCEDHPINRELASRLLDKKGVTVTMAVNGKLGVETFLSKGEGYFDAILMDIRMPVMDGLQATKAIRQIDRPDAKTIPIIAMTANAFEEDVKECLLAGMNAHIAKPIIPDTLYKVLAEEIGARGTT